MAPRSSDPVVELANDPLADAPLTPLQRQIWDSLRRETICLRQRVKELEGLAENGDRDATPNVPVILSRPEFNREVARMLAFDERYGGVSSMIYFDFDNLPELARRFDKATMNAATRQIGDSLVKRVRACDFVGRLDVSEFGVLLVRCDNANAWVKAERLAIDLHTDLTEIHGHSFHVSISFGAYTFSDEDDAVSGIHAAASALLAKRKGKR